MLVYQRAPRDNTRWLTEQAPEAYLFPASSRELVVKTQTSPGIESVLVLKRMHQRKDCLAKRIQVFLNLVNAIVRSSALMKSTT